MILFVFRRTEDVATASLLLEKYEVHLHDRKTSETRKTKHTRILIVVKNHIMHKIPSIHCSKSGDRKAFHESIIYFMLHDQWITDEKQSSLKKMAKLNPVNQSTFCDLIIMATKNSHKSAEKLLTSPNLFEN